MLFYKHNTHIDNFLREEKIKSQINTNFDSNKPEENHEKRGEEATMVWIQEVCFFEDIGITRRRKSSSLRR